MFTKESVNKFIAHLTWARINKPSCVPQPKFAAGIDATITNARLLLEDARAFVTATCDPPNANGVTLDDDGQGYRMMFEEAFAQLLAAKP